MKKLLAFVLALALALSLVACAKPADTTTAAPTSVPTPAPTPTPEPAPETLTAEYLTDGCWVYDKMEVGWLENVTEEEKDEIRSFIGALVEGIETDEQLFAYVTENVMAHDEGDYIVFSADGIGTAVTYYEDEENGEPFTWTLADNTVTVKAEGEEVILPYSNGALILQENDTIYCRQYLVKVKNKPVHVVTTPEPTVAPTPTPTPMPAPETLTAEYLAEGYWVMKGYTATWGEGVTEEDKALIRLVCSMMGTFETDEEMFVILCQSMSENGGTGYLKFAVDGTGTSYSYDMDDEALEDSSFAWALTDGVLTVTEDDETHPLDYKNGMLILSMDEDGLIVTVNIEKTYTEPQYPVKSMEDVLTIGYWVYDRAEAELDESASEQEMTEALAAVQAAVPDATELDYFALSDFADAYLRELKNNGCYLMFEKGTSVWYNQVTGAEETYTYTTEGKTATVFQEGTQVNVVSRRGNTLYYAVKFGAVTLTFYLEAEDEIPTPVQFPEGQWEEVGHALAWKEGVTAQEIAAFRAEYEWLMEEPDTMTDDEFLEEMSQYLGSFGEYWHFNLDGTGFFVDGYDKTPLTWSHADNVLTVIKGGETVTFDCADDTISAEFLQNNAVVITRIYQNIGFSYTLPIDIPEPSEQEGGEAVVGKWVYEGVSGQWADSATEAEKSAARVGWAMLAGQEFADDEALFAAVAEIMENPSYDWKFNLDGTGLYTSYWVDDEDGTTYHNDTDTVWTLDGSDITVYIYHDAVELRLDGDKLVKTIESGPILLNYQFVKE